MLIDWHFGPVASITSIISSKQIGYKMSPIRTLAGKNAHTPNDRPPPHGLQSTAEFYSY